MCLYNKNRSICWDRRWGSIEIVEPTDIPHHNASTLSFYDNFEIEVPSMFPIPHHPLQHSLVVLCAVPDKTECWRKGNKNRVVISYLVFAVAIHDHIHIIMHIHIPQAMISREDANAYKCACIFNFIYERKQIGINKFNHSISSIIQHWA